MYDVNDIKQERMPKPSCGLEVIMKLCILISLGKSLTIQDIHV